MKLPVWATWTLVAIPALMTIGSAAAKFAGAAPVVDTLTRLGVANYVSLFGVIELVTAGLFLYPLTRNIGFMLACSYFGGAMAAHLAHGESAMSPAVILAIYWAVMLVTKPSLFLSR